MTSRPTCRWASSRCCRSICGSTPTTSYKNVKADYVEAFWNVVNWADVQDRFMATTEDQWTIFG